MALENDITGNVTGKIRFTIDKASWNNLDKFQKKLTSVKRQMTDLNKTINVNAVVKSVDKVSTVQTKAINKVANAQVAATERVVKARKKAAKEGIGLEFGKATGADRTYAQWWQDSLKAQDARERKLEQLLNERDRRNIARRKRKGRSMAASSLMQERFNVESQLYLKTKLGQFASYAELNNLSAEKRAAGFSRIREGYQNSIGKNTGANYGDLQRFKNDLQGVTRELLTQERVARKNAISFASMRNELVQLTAAYGAFQTVANIARTGMKLEGIRAAAKVFTGDEAGTREHMAYLVAMSDRLGVNFMVAAQEFNKFSIAVGSKVSKGTQRHIFEALSEYATVLQVDQQQYERAIRSVVQMFSKEQVYA